MIRLDANYLIGGVTEGLRTSRMRTMAIGMAATFSAESG